MTATYHRDVVQGSTEWTELRRGKLTASEMRHIITPATLKVAANEKTRAHLYGLLAQRVVGYVEEGFTSDDMYRGFEDEVEAKQIYQANYGELEDCGFITNDKWGFTIGYSPDALVVPNNGLIEIKSRLHKLHVETILANVKNGTVPADFLIQVQTGLAVADDRDWLDFISFSAGLPMATVRIHPDPVVQDAIVQAAGEAERKLAAMTDDFRNIMHSDARLIATDRRHREQEIRV